MLKVGFVGLGVMGGPMALTIVKRGFPLTVFDLNPDAVAQLTKAGAKAAKSPREVGAASDIVVTMLPEPKHVEQVALGADGIADGLPKGGIVVEMSTIDPISSQRVSAGLMKRGIEMVDSPVGKTSEHAATGTLTLMIGGNAEAIKRAMPVLDCMGTDKFMCGAPGMGHAMKTTNNVLATAIMVANTEALAMGVKCGLTLETMIEVMKTTMAWNNQLAIAMHARALKGDFEPGFMLSLAHKDCRLAVKMNDDMGLPAPLGRALLEALEEGLASGAGGKDVGVLLKLREQEAGVEVRT